MMIKDLGIIPSETIAKKFSAKPHQDTPLMTGFGEVLLPCLEVLGVRPEQLLADTAAYTPELGIPELRSLIAGKISGRLGSNILSDQVVVSPGSKMAIYNLLQSLEGDVIIPVPSWPTYFTQAKMLGKRIIPFEAYPSGGSGFDLAAFKKLLQHAAGNTLILNSPSNPTGAVIQQEQMEEIACLCRAADVFIISDEVYADIVFSDNFFVSPYRYSPDNVAVIGSMSKSFSGGGWRGGYCVLPQGEAGTQLRTNIHAIAGATWSGCSAISQHILIALLSARHTPALLQVISDMHEVTGLSIYNKWKGEIDMLPPQGAFYLYLNFDEYRESLERNLSISKGSELEALFNRYQVPALSAHHFGANESQLSVRISYAQLLQPDAATLSGFLNIRQKEERLLLWKQYLQASDAYKFFEQQMKIIQHKVSGA
ncbi:pyridoxal phosphate-dependent aminotransferase [Chitinophaga sp. 22321]|uniref:Pyridoxal phosphate-dependent aminotransferase n=1 Tax=Chitinophaga hostae TaxID=2831022 RepID=A0ABS5J9A5_9BACT|nr:pyridoxal phosphate-dependent aminotransferase [Chitinophaga hostae]MBS0031784.1 pyridoxal phosphate-dependent aminotransferase [Chitinophaga hostae]